MNEEQPNGNPWVKSLLVWGGIFLALLMVVSMFGARSDVGSPIRYSDFRTKVAEGSVAEVQVGEDRIVGKYKNGDSFSTIPIPNDTTASPADIAARTHDTIRMTTPPQITGPVSVDTGVPSWRTLLPLDSMSSCCKCLVMLRR